LRTGLAAGVPLSEGARGGRAKVPVPVGNPSTSRGGWVRSVGMDGEMGMVDALLGVVEGGVGCGSGSPAEPRVVAYSTARGAPSLVGGVQLFGGRAVSGEIPCFADRPRDRGAFSGGYRGTAMNRASGIAQRSQQGNACRARCRDAIRLPCFDLRLSRGTGGASRDG